MGHLVRQGDCCSSVPEPSSKVRCLPPLQLITQWCRCATGFLSLRTNLGLESFTIAVCREVQYVLEDAKASVLLTTPDLADRMDPIARAAGAHLHVMRQEDESLPQVNFTCHL